MRLLFLARTFGPSAALALGIGLILIPVPVQAQSQEDALSGIPEPLPLAEAEAEESEGNRLVERLDLEADPEDLPPLPRISLGGDLPPASALGTPLVPDQPVKPIDLVSALRLAGVRDLDIAISRQRVAAALSDLELARTLWLPSVYIGPTWMRHDGRAQIVEGPVEEISKSSLFIGSTVALGEGVTGPVPAGGPAQVGALTSIIRISDAIFEPLAARQLVRASSADVDMAYNNAYLGTGESYMELQRAAGRLAIAREAATRAEELARLTSTYARTGAGLEADYRRSLVERDLRRREIEQAVGELEIASAELVRRLRIDPRILVAPVEPAEAVLHLVEDGRPLNDLIVTAWYSRPEMEGARAVLDAQLVRARQARLRPFVPSLSMRQSAGGYGGGRNDFFGNFDVRQDVDVNLFWQLQGLGFADRAIAKRAEAESREAGLRRLQVQDRVAAEVVSAEKARLAAVRQLGEASRAVPDALASLDLNLANIRRGAGLPGATRPIEVLQPIQALASARTTYLESVLDYNLAQFRLFHALGRPAQIMSVEGH